MSAPNAAQERLIISLAMGILGRRGGRVKSAKKADAVRENGKKGGRPPTQLQKVNQARVAAGVCRHCGGAVPCPSAFGDVRVGVRRKAK